MPWHLFMEIFCRTDRVSLNMVWLFFHMNKQLVKGNVARIGCLKKMLILLLAFC